MLTISVNTTTDLLFAEFECLLEVEGFGGVRFDGLEHVVSIDHDPEHTHTHHVFYSCYSSWKGKFFIYNYIKIAITAV